ncbi:MAG TPA: preprotein translocase subunit YajC [Longimicrobium sp.]|jgi:preprotein translocase subunit YajC|nr:preprotein translocase subunit YajC [Longimicrobium sp.]
MDILLLALIQAGGPAPQRGGGIISILPLIFLFILFWVMIIVPQRRQAKAHLEMVQALQKGDQVVTAGGIVGVITGLRDDAVDVKTGTATVVVERSKISRRTDAGGPRQA